MNGMESPTRTKGIAAALGMVLIVLLGFSAFIWQSGTRQTPQETANTPQDSGSSAQTVTQADSAIGGGQQQGALEKGPDARDCSIKFQGDADCDGLITVLDYTLWKNESVGRDLDDRDLDGNMIDADFDENGLVDDADRQIWLDSYNKAQQALLRE